MINKLEPIIKQKHHEVSVLKQLIEMHPWHEINEYYTGDRSATTTSLLTALSTPLFSIIAELKRKSPAKGNIGAIEDPLLLAEAYIKGGASALSILTDQTFFGGSAEDLQKVAKANFAQSTPILRKDFIVDNLQIAEAAYLGADAILCIVAVLGKKTAEHVAYAHKLGLEVLVEVHDEKELDIALNSGSKIIGVNNRNLSTFEVDTEQAIRLLEKIPEGYIKVAESGIFESTLARRYHQAGFDAALIGEALVKSNDPGAFIHACQNDTTTS